MRIFLFFIFSFCFYVPFAQNKKNVNSTSKFDNSSIEDNKILSNKDKSLLKNKQKTLWVVLYLQAIYKNT